MFNLESCAESAQTGNLQEWVLGYLAAGYWANLGLRDGLLLQKRYWIGPVSIELSRLERCCGPEDGMIYHVPHEVWKERIECIALGLVDAKSLPPLIVEWRDGNLIVCDGSHRHAAMSLKGWTTCFVVIWCNSEEDYRVAFSILSPEFDQSKATNIEIYERANGPGA